MPAKIIDLDGNDAGPNGHHPFDTSLSIVPDAIDTRTSTTSLRAILSDIQNGRWRSQVTKVRSAYAQGGKKAAAPLKKSLPAALFSGTFSVREDNHLTRHSGLICVDLDELGEKLEGVRDLIAQDPHTVAAFRSPTGTGLKVIFRCSSDPQDHIDSYRRAEQFVLLNFGLEIDPACKNVGRMCFVSDDPELFQADDAVPLPPVQPVQEFKAPIESKPGASLLTGKSPGDDYDLRCDMPALLKEHGWERIGRYGWIRPGGSQISATWDKIPGRFYVFSSNAPLPCDHTYKPWHVYAYLCHNGNFSQAAQALYAAGYGDRVKPAAQSTTQSNGAQSTTLKPDRLTELQTKLTNSLFNPAQQLPKPASIFEIAGTQICTPGNLTTIYSQAKTGKSSLIGGFLAATLTTPTSGHDCLGVTGPNYAGHAVLHFDTEQSPYDRQQLIQTTMRRVATTSLPPWLMSHCLTGEDALTCRQMVKLAIEEAHAKFQGIHSVIIDGVADLVTDPNDSAECFPLITELHQWAIRYATAIILILHQNAGSDNTKGRGHLGSQLERKSESNLTLTKDGDVTSITSTKQRGKSIAKDKAPSFRWSDEHEMHRTCGTPEALQEKKRGAPEKYAFSTFRSVFPAKTDQPLPLSQLASRCNQNQPITPKQLFPVLARWSEEGHVEIIETPQGRKYRMAL